MTLCPCPIDGKNLTQDWITDMFDNFPASISAGVFWTPDNSNERHQFLAYVNRVLVKCEYKIGANYLRFEAWYVGEANVEVNYAKDQSIRDNIDCAFDILKSKVAFVEEQGDIAVRYDQDKWYLDFFFYWKNDD